jgi:hypothetical protein
VTHNIFKPLAPTNTPTASYNDEEKYPAEHYIYVCRKVFIISYHSLKLKIQIRVSSDERRTKKGDMIFVQVPYVLHAEMLLNQ